jgi:hypothetical protein
MPTLGPVRRGNELTATSPLGCAPRHSRGDGVRGDGRAVREGRRGLSGSAALHDRSDDLPALREHRARLRQHIAQLRATTLSSFDGR